MNKPESKQESAFFPWLLAATEGRLRWQDRLPPATLKPRATSPFLNHKTVTNRNSSEEIWTQCDNSRDYIRPLLRKKNRHILYPSLLLCLNRHSQHSFHSRKGHDLFGFLVQVVRPSLPLSGKVQNSKLLPPLLNRNQRFCFTVGRHLNKRSDCFKCDLNM